MPYEQTQLENQQPSVKQLSVKLKKCCGTVLMEEYRGEAGCLKMLIL